MQDYIPRSIDINQTIPTVVVKQFDHNSRFLHVALTDIDLSDGDSDAFILQDCSAALYIQPEGNDDPSAVQFVAGDVADPENGILTFLLPGGVTQVVGRYECEIWIYEGDEATRPVISTKPFALVVEKSIRNDSAIEATQSMTALDAKMQQVNALQSQVNTLISLADGGDITPGSAEAEVIAARTGWDGAVYANLGEAIRVQVDQAAQYRAGINAQYATYHSHVYEYTKEGTFYATHANWSDLPDNAADFIIQNTRYGDNWVLQTATQASSPDLVYQRVVPRTEATGNYEWRRVHGDFSGIQSQIDAVNGTIGDLPQHRAGVNAAYADYGGHSYAYKKDGTFYATPANWSDLPTSDSPYVITNARYGSWVMQTAVRTANPEDVFTRFVAGTGADDAQYTYSWYKVGGRQDATQFGLPVLALFGDTSGMSKTNAVSLTFRTKDKDGNEIAGSCSVKWQGSSSLAYPKKNYTVTFDAEHPVDAGWGSQRKYCFKANYVDNSGALNVCGAKLWAAIVASRHTHQAMTHTAPNNGAVDGFPCVIMLNDEFLGLYTWNIPKDPWAYGMGSGAAEYIVTAEDHCAATQFNAPAELDGTDFKLEYAPENVSADTVKASLNTMISEVEIDKWNHFDLGTAIDYMIFSALIANTDGVDKNFILTTYNGSNWWLNAYDLDSILGNFWNGTKYYSPAGDNDNKTSFAWLANTSELFHIILTEHKAELIQRYNTLRAGILSEESVFLTFYNFCAAIPQAVIGMDNTKWPLKPGTSTETLSRIMEWYRLRCRFIDAEVQSWQ